MTTTVNYRSAGGIGCIAWPGTLLILLCLSLADAAKAAQFTFVQACNQDWHNVCFVNPSGCGLGSFKFQNNWGWQSVCEGAYGGEGVFPGSADDADLGSNTVTFDLFSSASVHNVTIGSGGTFSLSGGLTVSGSLVNNGNMSHAFGANFGGVAVNNNMMTDDSATTFANGAVTNNALIVFNNTDWMHGSGNSSFNNLNELRVNGSNSAFSGLSTLNDGLVNLQAGLLRFRDSGHASSVESTVDGQWQVANSATLQFTNCTLLGTMNLTNNGTARLDGTTSIPAGGFTINATANGLILNGDLTNNPAATLTNAAGSFIDMVGGANLNNGTFHNMGHVVTGDFGLAWVLNDLSFINDGELEVQAGEWNLGSGTPEIINNGTLRKTTTDFMQILALPVTNNGTIDVQAGTIRMRRGDIVGNDSGSWTIASGAGLELYEGDSSGVCDLSGIWHGTNNGSMTLGAGLSNFTVAAPGLTFDIGGNGLRWAAANLVVPAGRTLTNATNGILHAENGGQHMSGSFVNNGSWRQAGDRNGDDLTFINNGTFNWELGLWNGTSGGSLFINHGTVRKTTSGAALLRGAFDVRNDGSIILEQGCLEVPGTFLQTGGVTRLAGGCLQVGSGATAVFAGGRLEGSGDVGSVNVTGATVAPGLSAGNLHFVSNYTQGANGTLEIELGGLTAATEFDRVQVDGTATLGGTLDVSQINGFIPQAGQTFEILTAATVTGTFANVNCSGLYAVHYNPTNVTISIAFTPGICGCLPDTDSDGDGTPNCNDGCPNDPNKTSPGACGCGHADTDSDGDGVMDCADGCPNDPAKTSSGACGCGHADTDSDGDGTPDCNDGCPDDTNKTSAGACGCGVADADANSNGVPDCNEMQEGMNPEPMPVETPDEMPDQTNPPVTGSSGCGAGAANCGAGGAALMPLMAIGIGCIRNRRPRRHRPN